jgi:4'-phosphopantetheinyl transferase EntD
MTSSETAFLRRADRVVALFQGDVVGFETCATVPEALLHPTEATQVSKAIGKRRQDFAGGRLCARRALAELDIFDFPLLSDKNRAPLWPEQAVGSITHTRGYCAAVGARRAHYDGIGIDVERRDRLDRRLEPRICTNEERSWLATLPDSERADMATVLFSAKEAFYKCQYCVTGAWLGFHDVALTVEGDTFEVRLVKPIESLRERGQPLVGRFEIVGEHVFAAIGLRAQSRVSSP